MNKQKTKNKEVNEQPQDIGKLNIPNVMLWMIKNAYEQTTVKRVAKELRHLERKCNTSNLEEFTVHSQKRLLKRKKREPNRVLCNSHKIGRLDMEPTILSTL